MFPVNVDVCHNGNTRNKMNLHHQVSGSRPRQKRVKALVDCRAVGSEQLAFFKDEVIVVTATEDPHWWVSVLHSPSFPHCSRRIFRGISLPRIDSQKG